MQKSPPMVQNNLECNIFLYVTSLWNISLRYIQHYFLTYLTIKKQVCNIGAISVYHIHKNQGITLQTENMQHTTGRDAVCNIKKNPNKLVSLAIMEPPPWLVDSSLLATNLRRQRSVRTKLSGPLPILVMGHSLLGCHQLWPWKPIYPVWTRARWSGGQSV
jgi:hypothetical protein